VTREFGVSEERPSVSYGPTRNLDEWVLAVTCEDERVEIVFDERTMYDLWVEVRGVPWPDPPKSPKNERLVRQLVHAANGADEEMLQDALEALGVRR
jgi:hypothetical protein